MAVKKPQPAKQKKSKDLDVGKTKVGEKVKGGKPLTPSSLPDRVSRPDKKIRNAEEHGSCRHGSAERVRETWAARPPEHLSAGNLSRPKQSFSNSASSSGTPAVASNTVVAHRNKIGHRVAKQSDERGTMMWRCQGHNCGYTYDPAKGDKRGKIPRGSPSRTFPRTGSAPAAVPARRCSRRSTAEFFVLVSGRRQRPRRSPRRGLLFAY